MNGTTPVYLTCTEVRKRLRTHFLLQSEVPTEYALSFPIPTRRWGNPGYALFASPALRVLGRQKEQGAPDRWWVMGAQNGHLLAYALCSAVPFTTENWPSSVLSPLTGTIAGLRDATGKLEKSMDAQSSAFFHGEAGIPARLEELKQALTAVLPRELLPQYRALAPDFWNWLEAP
jgi:hypothetical protein